MQSTIGERVLNSRAYRIDEYLGVVFTSAEDRSAGTSVGSPEPEGRGGGFGVVCRQSNETHQEPTRTTSDRAC